MSQPEPSVPLSGRQVARLAPPHAGVAERAPDQRGDTKGKQPPPARPNLLVLETPPVPDRAAEDRDFLPAALAIVEQPPSPLRVAFTWALCAMLAAALGWSILGHLDMYAVAPGKIQASGRTKVVEPLSPGKVIAIAVKDGDHVKQGDLLIQLDPTETLATETATADALNSVRAEMARLEVEITAAEADPVQIQPKISWSAAIPQYMREREERVLASDLSRLAAMLADLKAQRDAKVAERDKYGANIVATKALIANLSEHTEMTEKLLKDGWASRAKYLEMLQPVLQAKELQTSLEGSLSTAIAEITVTDAQIVQTRDTFLSADTSKLAEDERHADQLDQELVKATQKLREMTLRAPITGTVQASAVTTLGQVVTTGQQLMQVVPDGLPLEIEAYVENTDVGFVAVGQPANIKIDTFPYSRYGSIDGTVVKLANDAIPGKQGQQQQNNGSQPASMDGQMSITTAAEKTQDLVFPVIVTPAQTTIDVGGGKRVPLSSGMTVTVEIKTESRRVISYILSPLVDVFSTAGHER